MTGSEREMWAEMVRNKYGIDQKKLGEKIPPSSPAPIHKPPGMNRSEAEYAQQLELRKRSGEIIDYRFEGIKFVLADNTTYKPDFLVVFPGHFEIQEVKGFERDDAIVKFKVAAALFPWFRFIMVKKIKGRFEIIREI